MKQDRFKFRVWNWNEEKMLYTSGLGYETNQLIESKGHVIMQCTGLKDINGKLIYEGDIVKVSGYGVEGIFKMFWDDITACFCISIYESDCFEHSQSVMEVIGNIYENKDIMYYG